MGPRMLIATRGSHGAMLFNGQDLFSAPAYPLEDERDPTGAGDSFAGGFFGYLAQCPALDPAAHRACRSGWSVGTIETMAGAGFLSRSLSRIVGCLDGLTDEDIPWRPRARR